MQDEKNIKMQTVKNFGNEIFFSFLSTNRIFSLNFGTDLIVET